MGRYEGIRTSEGVVVTRVDDGTGERHALPLRLDLCNHSPTGFEWSYGGSGPAQLALALLADVFQNEEAVLGLYQSFKWEVVASLPWRAWSLTESEVRDAAMRTTL